MASNTVVQTNIQAMNTHRNMKNVGLQQQRASEKLSSGFKINRAADDATGLAISEKMRAQIRGLDMASKNVSDAVSLIATAEGGMQGVDDMLHRIRELVDFAANDTNENNAVGTGDRQKIQDEIDQLVEEIDSMSERVEFNKKKLIDGSFQDTKAQLANAKDLWNLLSLEKTTTAAKTAALQANLISANADLTSTQAALTAGLVTYTAAVQTFGAAQMTYDTIRNEYNDAMQGVNEALANAGLSQLSQLTADMFTPTSAGYLGEEKAPALSAAIERYNAAAKALGVDELAAQDVNATIWGKITTTAKVTNGDANKDWNGTAKKAVATFNTAKSTFAGEELKYQKLVSARDVAQTKVNSVQEQLTEATRAMNSANTKFNAADISYNAAKTLDQASNSRALHFQVGSNANQSLIMSIGSLKSDTLGIGDGKGKTYLNVVKDTGQDITATLDVLDQALSYVTTERSKLGAAQNRMEYTQQSLDITSENISDAESRIRDTDMAKEMMNYTKANILQQVSVSMMAQANQVPQSVLQLLQ